MEKWFEELTDDETSVFLEAIEELEIIELVSQFHQGKGKVETIKTLKSLLEERFPEITILPSIKQSAIKHQGLVYIFPPLSGEFRIIRALVAWFRKPEAEEA